MADVALRITVGLTTKANEAVDWLAEHTGLSKTDIVNRGVQLYQFVEQWEANGSHLGLIRPDGSVNLVKLL